MPRPVPSGAVPLSDIHLTTMPRYLTFDSGLKMYHFEGMKTHQFTDLIGQVKVSGEHIVKRLCEVYWPGLRFHLPSERRETPAPPV